MSYPFLAQPPPQKTRPTQAPPCVPTSPRTPTRRRSATTSAISAWLTHIQPGTPAPLSPHRRPSLSRSPRRASGTPTRIPSASFLTLSDTPTTARTRSPSIGDFKADFASLTTNGYASVFVQLPTTPRSAPATRQHAPSASPIRLPVPPCPSSPKKKPLTRIRALSFRTATAMLSSKKNTAPRTPKRAKSRSGTGKARYAHLRPAPLATEVQLAQLLDGGTLNDNVRRVMQAEAAAAGGAHGVSAAHRDGAGGIWWDQDEEWEYAQLLADPASPAKGSDGWVGFDDAEAEERRGSLSSQDSELVPQNAVPAAEDDLAAFGGAVAPRRPGLSVLALAARPRRTAKHLQAPAFLVDPFALGYPRLPLSPTTGTHYPSSPTKPAKRARGYARRRPAPLTLQPPSPAFQRPWNSPADARRAFLEDSFVPLPSSPVRTAVVGAGVKAGSPGARARVVKSKRSKLDVRGIFKLGRRE